MFTYAIFVFFGVLMTVHGYSYIPQDLPICISHGGLCDITFDIKPEVADKIESLDSSSPICKCPSGRACPSGNFDKDRTLDLQMNSNGRILKTRLSYCEPIRSILRPCRFEEVVVTLRGVGPIVLDIVDDVMCTCQDELTHARTKPDGMYSLRQYTCGKRECRVNDIDQPACERSVRYMNGSNVSGDEDVATEYPCVCPVGYECSDPRHALPGASDAVTELTCAYPSSWWWSWW